MQKYNLSKYHNFYVIGISYKKANADMRGLFSLDKTHQELVLSDAKTEGMDALTLISTCNRTEIYGFAEHPFQLIQKLCKHSKASVDDFHSVGYVYKNKDAIEHIFKVGTGLDSQILGDFEIIGQLKKSFLLSKKYNLVNSFLDRLQNSVIQASKRIKNETELSSGATSVAFASVQYILENVENISQKKILLFGVGKIGQNTCENLVKHTNNQQVTLINRTNDKAREFGGKLNVIVKDYQCLYSEIATSDILIVATGAQNPTIDQTMIPIGKPMLILDLSIPRNVDKNVEQMPNVTLVHMDYLSQITDNTLEKRKGFIPMAEQIINEVKSEFTQWLDSRKFAPTIQSLKTKLEHIKNSEIDFQRKKIANFNEQQAEVIASRIIQKITTHFMSHLKETSSVDESLTLLQEVFQLEEK